MSRKIVFATGNAGKLREIAEIMNEYEVVSMKDAGVNIDIDENGTTFEENALIKARAVWNVTGGIVLADDSGLEIDYLDRAPGIMSARFISSTRVLKDGFSACFLNALSIRKSPPWII